MLLRHVFACAQAGKDELELDVSTLRRYETSPHSLADSFCVTGTLAAASIAALQGGDFQLYLQGGVGPSGARMMGRFCHEDPEIEAGVRNHIQQEEAQDREAVYAEVVYLPEGRIGNVLCRPVLRDYEIPYLGRSGAEPERQLPVNDLLVGIEGTNIVLYSRRLGRRVIPRLTNAHGFMNPQLSSIYRFFVLHAASAWRFRARFFLGGAGGIGLPASSPCGVTSSIFEAMETLGEGSGSDREGRREFTLPGGARFAAATELATVGGASGGR